MDDKKYRTFPKKTMLLRDLLPMFQASGYSNYDESGQNLIICPEVEEWTHAKFNLHSGLLAFLGDLVVTDIDANKDGDLIVWVETDDFNWFQTKEAKA